jgi:hypothetical protein
MRKATELETVQTNLNRKTSQIEFPRSSFKGELRARRARIIETTLRSHAPPDYDLDSLLEQLKDVKICRTEERWHSRPLYTICFRFRSVVFCRTEPV